MSNRRSSTEVKFDILRTIASGERKPTHIMERANTSWIILQSYLVLLEHAGLVSLRTNGFRVEWFITEKGRRSLEFYEAATAAMTS